MPAIAETITINRNARNIKSQATAWALAKAGASTAGTSTSRWTASAKTTATRVAGLQLQATLRTPAAATN